MAEEFDWEIAGKSITNLIKSQSKIESEKSKIMTNLIETEMKNRRGFMQKIALKEHLGPIQRALQEQYVKQQRPGAQTDMTGVGTAKGGTYQDPSSGATVSSIDRPAQGLPVGRERVRPTGKGYTSEKVSSGEALLQNIYAAEERHKRGEGPPISEATLRIKDKLEKKQLGLTGRGEKTGVTPTGSKWGYDARTGAEILHVWDHDKSEFVPTNIQKPPKGRKINKATTEQLEKLAEAVQNEEITTQKQAADILDKNQQSLELQNVDINYIKNQIVRVLPEKYEPGKSKLFGVFGKATPARRVKRGVLEEEKQPGVWAPVEIKLPENIKKTSQALKYLMQEYSMSEDEAKEWIRGQ